ncbi:serine proteinase stubble-like isoform X2 [Photinus pyralis]|uniref:serine proteinase stubble-like isoform X2 n=1 Tax=Photinus pyralis TaxID=7054 RepID=UPI0012673DDD|nr:serine proteinase stubble-like isoform X2 [Photinus pyralis]
MEIALLLVISTFVAGFWAMNNYVPCGRRKLGRAAKVVGGENATEGEFPWLVSLTRRGGHFCGGSLITKTHVLTAGHCLCSGSSPIPTNQIRVTVAQHDLVLPSPYKYERSVHSAILHPEYICNKVKNDLAILELEKELEWSDRVLPACLPETTGGKQLDDVLATVAGWGWTNENNQLGGRADTLQKATVNILKMETCRAWYKSQGKKTKIHDTQICAGYEQGGIDSCWADSGGPLMVTTNSGEQMVVGVVSTGIGCARPLLPGLYTRVSDFIPWIESVVKK